MSIQWQGLLRGSQGPGVHGKGVASDREIPQIALGATFMCS